MTKALDALELAAATAIDAGISMKEFRQLAAAVMIDVAVNRAGGNQCRAAKLIGTHRNTLWLNWHKVQKTEIRTVHTGSSTTRNIDISST